jgi:Protein of unknown function (DUF3305)
MLVQVLFECKVNAHGEEQPWAVIEVLPDEIEAQRAGVAISGQRVLQLFKDEGEGYYLNLSSGEPSIFVHWRLSDSNRPEAIFVTLSYNEAARRMDAGEQVDRVPMPAEMAAWLAEYTDLNYRPESGKKRRGAKPSFMHRDDFAKMAQAETELSGRKEAR